MQNGIPGLTFQEIKAWGELRGITPSFFELKILTELAKLSNE